MMIVVTNFFVSCRWADLLRSRGTNPNVTHNFDHPYFQVRHIPLIVSPYLKAFISLVLPPPLSSVFQAAEMFLGEMSCIVVFKVWFYHHKYRKLDMKVFGPQKFNPLVWAVPAMCDLLGTSTMYVGLTWTFAASFQMLRGSVIIFTGLLSVAFLGTRLRLMHWTGMFAVIVGLVVVGLADYVSAEAHSSNHLTYIVAGDLLIVLAQVITAIQMTVEEKLIKKYKVPPLQAVGWEGIFGFSVLAVAMVPMYFIPWHLPSPPEIWQRTPRFEDAIDAFVMLGNNWKLLFASIGTVISIAFFNFAGLTVTSTMNATTRMVLDSVRTIFIWAFSLGVNWEQFQYLQPVGYFILFVGTCIYYDIIIMPTLRWVYRRFCKRYEMGSIQDAEEKKPMLPQPKPGHAPVVSAHDFEDYSD